jgi:hypothetical protein
MHYPKNISLFTMGVVVKSMRSDEIGHVVGFTLNSTDEVLIMVRFPRPLHPTNVKLLTV